MYGLHRLPYMYSLLCLSHNCCTVCGVCTHTEVISYSHTLRMCLLLINANVCACIQAKVVNWDVLEFVFTINGGHSGVRVEHVYIATVH